MALLLAIGSLRHARADSIPFLSPLDAPNLIYTGEPDNGTHFWRALTEQTFLNALGVVQYFIRIEVNIVDWKYQPTADGMKQKIVDGWEWDTNTFRTNTVYHAYSGALYYQIGRANGYGPAGSTAWSFGSSLMWEYIGEFREQVSANDMIVTGLAGPIVGEALRQTSLALERVSRPNPISTFFVYLFDPFRKLNEQLDRAFAPAHYRVRLGLLTPTHPAWTFADGAGRLAGLR